MRAAERDRGAGGGRLHGAPGAERQPALAVAGERHRGGQRADREQPAAEADQRCRARNSSGDASGAAKITAENANSPTSAPNAASR